MLRKMGIGAVLATVSVALSGCVVFASPPTAKFKKKSGIVQITVKACASQNGGSPPPGSCTNQGNANAPAFSDKNQVFLGFRVPSKSKPPQSFSAKTGPASGGPKLHFTKSSSYTGQLASNAPAPAGQKWQGYWSQYFDYSSTSGQQNFTAKPGFGLPKSFTGKFKYKVVVGGRVTGSSSPNANSPVNCMGNLTKLQPDPSNSTDFICVDDSASGSLTIHR
jgi:hypothetical protein